MPRLSDTALTIAELGLRFRLEEQARWLAELRAQRAGAIGTERLAPAEPATSTSATPRQGSRRCDGRMHSLRAL